MAKPVIPHLYDRDAIIYPKGSGRAHSVIQTPDQLIVDEEPMYQLRWLEHPHIKSLYPQRIVDSEWSLEPFIPNPPSQAPAMSTNSDTVFNGPFLGRQVILHKDNGRGYLVLQTPATCEHNGFRSYLLKQLGLGPDTPPFYRTELDVEMHWKPLEQGIQANYAYVKIADVVDILIRGDMLETQIFPETGPYYVLGTEGVGEDWRCLCRRIKDGVAETEVRKFTREDLLKNFRVHTLQVMSIQATTPKYTLGAEMKHRKSGEIYTIALLPTKVVIEATREPAYGFLMPDGRICIRSQVEVEDASRFEPYVSPTTAVNQ